jgi:ribosome-binding factor A
MAKHERRSREALARDGGFRGQRLEGLLREELNSLLDGEIADPRLDGVRLTRVELARDGSSARVWFAHSGGGAPSHEAAHAAFEHAAGFLRSRLCDALPLKRSPELRFRHDPAARLEARLLEEVK